MGTAGNTMKAYERRAAGKPTYYKLASWDFRQLARADAKKPGQYRLSFIDDRGNRTDLEPFTV